MAGRIAVSERWRTARLLAAALALSAAASTEPPPPTVITKNTIPKKWIDPTG